MTDEHSPQHMMLSVLAAKGTIGVVESLLEALSLIRAIASVAPKGMLLEDAYKEAVLKIGEAAEAVTSSIDLEGRHSALPGMREQVLTSIRQGIARTLDELEESFAAKEV